MCDTSLFLTQGLVYPNLPMLQIWNWETIFVLFSSCKKQSSRIWANKSYDSINASPPSSAYMRLCTGPSLFQVMAWRRIGAKPLPEPILAYCQLDSWEQISVKFESEVYHFHSSKCIWKCRLPKWRPFCPGGDKLRNVCTTKTKQRKTKQYTSRSVL